MPKSKSTPLIVEDELNALKEENAKLKTELAACQAKLIEVERLTMRDVTWEAATERQLAKYVADFAKNSEVKAVKARNYSKAMAITEAQKATIHYNEIYDRRNMDASAPQRMAAMLAGDKAMFIAAATAMNLVEPQLKAEAHEGSNGSAFNSIYCVILNGVTTLLQVLLMVHMLLIRHPQNTMIYEVVSVIKLPIINVSMLFFL